MYLMCRNLKKLANDDVTERAPTILHPWCADDIIMMRRNETLRNILSANENTEKLGNLGMLLGDVNTSKKVLQ